MPVDPARNRPIPRTGWIMLVRLFNARRDAGLPGNGINRVRRDADVAVATSNVTRVSTPSLTGCGIAFRCSRKTTIKIIIIILCSSSLVSGIRTFFKRCYCSCFRYCDQSSSVLDYIYILFLWMLPSLQIELLILNSTGLLSCFNNFRMFLS